MLFWKMNGAGNDFIVLNNMVEKLDHSVLPLLARTLCHRHMSIGADGLIIEVHNDPSHALCDGAQSITPAQFDALAQKVRKVSGLVHSL